MKDSSKLLSLKRHRADERGQGMAEYIIIVILVAIIVLIGIRIFGKKILNQFNNASEEIEDLRQ